jgi:hypothetical protein
MRPTGPIFPLVLRVTATKTSRIRLEELLWEIPLVLKPFDANIYQSYRNRFYQIPNLLCDPPKTSPCYDIRPLSTISMMLVMLVMLVVSVMSVLSLRRGLLEEPALLLIVRGGQKNDLTASDRSALQTAISPWVK